MSPFAWSLVVWAGVWGGLFLVLELWALSEWPAPPPWNTLTWTVRQLIARGQVGAMAVGAGMAALAVHFYIKRAKRGEREGRR